jgi:KUP system potassium uptake protein
LRPIGDGFYQLVVRYGYMEAPRVHQVVEEVALTGALSIDPDAATYYFGRRSFVASERGHMGHLTEEFFAFLSRNARAADRHFGAPPESVVELGSRIDL